MDESFCIIEMCIYVITGFTFLLPGRKTCGVSEKYMHHNYSHNAKWKMTIGQSYEREDLLLLPYGMVTLLD